MKKVIKAPAKKTVKAPAKAATVKKIAVKKAVAAAPEKPAKTAAATKVSAKSASKCVVSKCNPRILSAEGWKRMKMKEYKEVK